MKKRLLALSLALVMALGLCVTTAWAEDINYLRWDDTAKELVLDTLAAGTTTKPIDTTTTEWNTTDGCWYAASGDVTIKGKVTANGDVNLLLMNGCTLTIEDGIVVTGNLTICAQSLEKDVAGKLIVSSKDITGDTAVNYGIYVTKALTINGGTVTATAGEATASSIARSDGLYVENELTIRNSTVTATGGKATGLMATSSGINGNTLVISNSTVEANGGEVNGQMGASSRGTNLDTLTLNSGTVTGLSSSSKGGIHTGTALNLPTAYQWYMAEDGTPIASSDRPFTMGMEDDYSYLKITSVITTDNEDEEDVNTSPDTDPVPDTEPVSGGHTPVRRQNTTTATTEAAATDTTTDTTKTDTVTSAKTFDVGTAVYGVLAVASLLGMGYVGKKR